MVRKAMDEKGKRDRSENRHSTLFNLPLQGWSNVESGKKIERVKKVNPKIKIKGSPVTLADASTLLTFLKTPHPGESSESEKPAPS
jgi:hypothetical protein